MFNGIVETIGEITQIQKMNDCIHFSITTSKPLPDLFIGASVSINGVCLTATEFLHNTFYVTAVPETLRVTNLGTLELGSLVNIESSMKVSSRIGGHYVQGHVDGVGEIIDISTDGNAALLIKIKVSPDLVKYMVNKGYVALDGMSITVIQSGPDWITITLIPHTQEVTIAKYYKTGTKINIEVDILSKYVEKLLGDRLCNPI